MTVTGTNDLYKEKPRSNACLPQIPQRVPWNRIRLSALKGR